MFSASPVERMIQRNFYGKAEAEKHLKASLTYGRRAYGDIFRRREVKNQDILKEGSNGETRCFSWRYEKGREACQSCCTANDSPTDALRSDSRRQAVSAIRRQLALKWVKKIGLSTAETGGQPKLTSSGVAQILRRNSQ